MHPTIPGFDLLCSSKCLYLVLQSSRCGERERERERVVCFILIVFFFVVWLLCSTVSHSRGAVGWSVIVSFLGHTFLGLFLVYYVKKMGFRALQ